MLKHGKTGKLLSLILALAIVLALLPVTATPALAATGRLYVGGGDGRGGFDIASNQSGEGWTWTAATNTLALNGDYESGRIDIETESAVTISVTGEVCIDAVDRYAAIWVGGALTITGPGGGELTTYGSDRGIIAFGNILITGNTTVNAEGYGDSEYDSQSIVSEVGEEEEGTITVNQGSTLNLVNEYEGGFPSYYGNLVIHGTLKYNGKTLHEYAEDLAEDIVEYSEEYTQGLLAANVSDTVVTVTGGATGATGQLILYIPRGVEVLWRASLYSVENYNSGSLVVLEGGGVFEVGFDGLIRVMGSNSTALWGSGGVTVNVHGGAVGANNGVGSTAIRAHGCTLNVSSGNVSSFGTDTSAIFADLSAAVVHISGGTITATGEHARAVFASSGSELDITAGNITASGDYSAAVYAQDGSYGAITGGIITATVGEGSYAVYYNLADTEGAQSYIEVGPGATIRGATFTGKDDEDHTKPTVGVLYFKYWDDGGLFAFDGNEEIYGNIDLMLIFSEPIFAFGDYGSITLNPGNITFYGEWQGSQYYSAFTNGLLPETEYTLTISGYRDVNGNVMDDYSSISFTTGEVKLQGGVIVNGERAYGKTLTAEVTDLYTNFDNQPLGELTYSWRSSKDNFIATIGTGSSYKLQDTDIDYEVEVWVTAANAAGYRRSYHDWAISKAPASDLSVANTTIYIPIDTVTEETLRFDLSTIALVPAYGDHGGVVTYPEFAPVVVDPDDVLDEVVFADNWLEYTLDNTSVSGASAMLGFELVTANFESVPVYITFLVTRQEIVYISDVTVESRLYNGQPIAPTGTVSVTGGYNPAELAYQYYGTAADGEDYTDYDNPPTKAGSYELNISTPHDEFDYIGSLSIPFTIGKAPLTFIADDKSFTIGTAGSPYTYTIQGLVPGDTKYQVLEDEPYLYCETDEETVGEFSIEIAGAHLRWDDKGSNYEIVGYTSGTLTVSAAPGGGGGGGGGGGAGGGDTGGGDTTETASAADGEVSLTYTKSGETVTPALPAAKVTEIIEKSEGTASIDLSGVAGTSGATLPKTALDAFADAGLDLELKLASGTVTISEETLDSIVSQVTGANVTVSVNTVARSSLTAAQRAAIGDGAVVLDVSVNAGSQAIHEFDGTITVTVPYTGELPVAVWYLNDAGELEKLVCTYDPVTKTVTFTLDHLSLYVLALDTDWQNPFTDVKGTDWFYGDVEYAVTNGLFNGTSATTFSPGSPMTRGMLITVLARLAGQETDGGEKWYSKAIEWGVEQGITDGTNPEGIVSREQLVTLLYRFAGSPAVDTTLAASPAFSDVSAVSDYAEVPFAWAISAGIIQGSDGKLNPQGSSSRAQVAAVLHRFAELGA